MNTEYTACCDRLGSDCICEAEEVTAVEFDEVAEARLVKSHGGFVDLLTRLSETMRRGAK